MPRKCNRFFLQLTHEFISQLTFTCLKSTVEKLEICTLILRPLATGEKLHLNKNNATHIALTNVNFFMVTNTTIVFIVSPSYQIYYVFFH